jgi:tRNA-2-methylthio-N6-dimethylallyladenosine synthase
MPPKFYIETYGCQMNVYDSELVSTLMIESGYEKTDNLEDASAIFLNTCSIRDNAEVTVHNRLSNLQALKRRNPSLILGVLGCMAQNLKNDLLESKPYVDIILGPDSYRRLPEIIKQRQAHNTHIVDTKLSKYEVYKDLFPTRSRGVNAWIAISRGCDKFCTYCIVPFTRGRERNRTIDSIVDEVKIAISNGFIEITLLGQNVNSYRTSDGNFPELLEAVAKVNGLKRIRFTSPHPQDVDDEMLQIMAKYDNICEHIHLPLQAGSDRVLKRMNRTYTKEQYLNLVDRIRNHMPDCSISTDIIVGFPGESDDEFKETLEVSSIVRFDSAFMFKFSPRPGTKAVEYTDNVEEQIKQKRLESLIALQKINTLKANQRHVGKTLSVLIEKTSKKSDKQWAGRTGGNTWVVFDKSDEYVKDIINVYIDDAQGVTLFGHRVI